MNAISCINFLFPPHPIFHECYELHQFSLFPPQFFLNLCLMSALSCVDLLSLLGPMFLWLVFHERSQLCQSSMSPPWFSFDLCFMNVIWDMSILSFFLSQCFFNAFMHQSLLSFLGPFMCFMRVHNYVYPFLFGCYPSSHEFWWWLHPFHVSSNWSYGVVLCCSSNVLWTMLILFLGC